MHPFRTFYISDVFIAFSARYSLFVLMCRKTHITHSFTEFQSGFRHQRSTNDHLVRLETFIREAFIMNEHLVAVFFDLEKAYDTTWKYGIMNDLHEIGLKGRLPIFVQKFISNGIQSACRLNIVRSTQSRTRCASSGWLLAVLGLTAL